MKFINNENVISAGLIIMIISALLFVLLGAIFLWVDFEIIYFKIAATSLLFGVLIFFTGIFLPSK